MKDEVKISGLNAVLAVAEYRIDDVIRVYLTEDRIPDLTALLKHCAGAKKAYHVVERDELERVAESMHHEGVCVLARRKPTLTFAGLAKSLARDPHAPCTLVLLEDVKNPHNIGAILRIAAHFGVRALLLLDQQQASRPSSALLRTAEGGAESVDMIGIEDALEAVDALRELGFSVLATSSHARESIYARRPKERVVVLLGAEGEGLTSSAMQLSDEVVAIPGTGAVESLNVASAAAIILGEVYRAQTAPRPREDRRNDPRNDRRGKSRR